MIIVAAASGTSADGIDLGLFDVTWQAPEDADDSVDPDDPDNLVDPVDPVDPYDPAGSVDIGMRVLGSRTDPWPPDLADAVLALLPPAPATIAQVCALDTEIGQEIGRSVRRALSDLSDLGDLGDLGADAVELVVSPGQTVYHDVRDGSCRGTLQLGQPAWVVEATGLPVVSDLRARDVSAGGHGAPLASTFDGLWLAGDQGRRAALNLGGIANVTVVGAADEPVLAWDTGPANCLVDVAAARVTGGQERCDRDGRLALAGRVRHDLLTALLRHPHFALAPPASTGREAFSERFLDETLAGFAEVPGEDVLATLTELTAVSIAAALRPYDVMEVVASGGGTHNPAMMSAIRRALGTVPLVPSDERGLSATAKETAMWALLGFLTWHGVPGVNGATGARIPHVLGRISPGDRPLVLPAPVAASPRRLRLS